MFEFLVLALLFGFWLNGVSSMMQGVWWGFVVFGTIPILLITGYLLLSRQEPETPLTRFRKRLLCLGAILFFVFIPLGIWRLIRACSWSSSVEYAIKREDTSTLLGMAKRAYWHSDGKSAIEALGKVLTDKNITDERFSSAIAYLYTHMTEIKSPYNEEAEAVVLRIARSLLIEPFEKQAEEEANKLSESDYQIGKQIGDIPVGQAVMLYQGRLPDDMFIGKTLDEVQNALNEIAVVIVIKKKREAIGKYKSVGAGVNSSYAGTGYQIYWNTAAYDVRTTKIIATTQFLGQMPPERVTITQGSPSSDDVYEGAPPEYDTVTSWLTDLRQNKIADPATVLSH